MLIIPKNNPLPLKKTFSVPFICQGHGRNEQPKNNKTTGIDWQKHKNPGNPQGWRNKPRMVFIESPLRFKLATLLLKFNMLFLLVWNISDTLEHQNTINPCIKPAQITTPQQTPTCGIYSRTVMTRSLSKFTISISMTCISLI